MLDSKIEYEVYRSCSKTVHNKTLLEKQEFRTLKYEDMLVEFFSFFLLINPLGNMATFAKT